MNKRCDKWGFDNTHPELPCRPDGFNPNVCYRHGGKFTSEREQPLLRMPESHVEPAESGERDPLDYVDNEPKCTHCNKPLGKVVGTVHYPECMPQQPANNAGLEALWMVREVCEYAMSQLDDEDALISAPELLKRIEALTAEATVRCDENENSCRNCGDGCVHEGGVQ